MTVAGARVGVDVGGTFTDVILHGAEGRVVIRKLLSTPPSYDLAVVEAVGGLAAGPAGGPVAEVVHGTTVATNAVLERRGSRTALVTTAGFRDVLELRRLRIPHMYDLFWRKPPPLVERHLRFELNERVAADGTVVRALDDGESRALADRLREMRVQSVAVCFLHSYLYPEHELRFGAILAEELPEANVSLSSEILREQREYERSATTVVNAYVRPLMSSYIDRIRSGLDEIGIDGPLQIMQSSGGVMTAEDAKQRPVFALESGPAAGVVAARGMGQRLGVDNLLAFDMGGTTAKASLIEDGAISRGREYEVGGSMSAGSRLIRGAGELLRIPTIDIAEVGAGGGSIAWIDPAGGLQVGPRSAGADPGPACYARGGVEPTVTDANVLLGYMPAATVADGQVSISAEYAEQAVLRVAEPLGLTPLEAASGIHRIANARMTRALRAVSSEKGRDPRDFALIAYGGAGPIHAAGLAEDLGMRTVLVPAVAGLFSAVGLLFARPEFHEVRTCHLDVDAADPAVLAALFAEMEAKLVHALDGYSEVEWARTADLRYGGQSWEVEIGFPAGTIAAEAVAALRARFEDEHERLYGVKDQAGSPVEIRALRLAALGAAPTARSFQLDGACVAGSAAGSSRLIHIDGDDVETPVRTRSSLGDAPEPGPLLVDEYDTTVVVPDGWSARRDAATGTLVLDRGADGH
ncbi:MAG: hydantoinase/oxoprolinase family protein [Gaiellaceae bacterium MAG52_C11]|nr:hydantoinase/oxoprolinase family protein [Candidatus Gaiellasilicea maunaloa]